MSLRELVRIETDVMIGT